MNPTPSLPMEPEEMRAAWRALDTRLARQESFVVADRKRRAVRSGLAPLVLGQGLQLLFGVASVLVGVWLWTTFHRLPVVLACGVVVHVYGVAVSAMSVAVLARVFGLDASLPVVELQERLAKLHRTHVVSGAVAGLPWWLLWTVPWIVVAALGHQGRMGGPFVTWLALSLGCGVAGLAVTWWFLRRAKRPGREAFATPMTASSVGAALRRARAELDAIRSFEEE